VNELLYLNGGLTADNLYFLTWKLTGDHHSGKAERGEKTCRLCVMPGCLGTDVERKLRDISPCKCSRTDICGYYRIRSILCRPVGKTEPIRSFSVIDQGVESDIYLHTVRVSKSGRLSEGTVVEILGIGSCTEGTESQIYRIRPAFNCRLKSFGRAGGSEKFRQFYYSIFFFHIAFLPRKGGLLRFNFVF